jgi:hypothetical protein
MTEVITDASCKNFTMIFNFLEIAYPTINLKEIIEDIPNEAKYFVIDEETGRPIRPSLEYLKKPDNWASFDLGLYILSYVRELTGNQNLFFDCGKEGFIQSQKGVKSSIIKLLDIKTIISRIPREKKKYNSTKEVEIIKLEKGIAVLRLTPIPPRKAIKDICDQNRGVYEGIAKFLGVHVEVTETQCPAPLIPVRYVS